MSEDTMPEKWEWTDADFEDMSWHDCPFRGFAVLDLASYWQDEGNLIAFDLDYILEWVPKRIHPVHSPPADPSRSADPDRNGAWRDLVCPRQRELSRFGPIWVRFTYLRGDITQQFEVHAYGGPNDQAMAILPAVRVIA
jgi:hypothetical protein